MKTKITLGFLIGASLIGVVLGLIWTKSLSDDYELSSYFSETEEIYLFYRPNECSVNDIDWEVNGVKMNSFLHQELNEGNWKSVIAQRIDDQQITLVFEQNRGFRDADLDNLCQKLNIPIERKLMTVRDVQGVWTIQLLGNYIVISSNQQRSPANSKLNALLKNRDTNASFAFIHDGEIQEYYCFPQVTKAFAAFTMDELQVNSIGSMDFVVYNVVPKSVSHFEFIDKDLLVALYPDWSKSALLEYVETGLIFSALNNVEFYVLPISDLFSAKEILGSMAGQTDEANSAIKMLSGVVPNQQKILAMSIENSIILSSSQGVLESIALSYQMQSGFNTTKIFSSMMTQSSNKVHYRWYNRQKLLASRTTMRLPMSNSYGYAYFRNRDKKMRYVSVNINKQEPKEVQSSNLDNKVRWNYSLKNIQSTIHQNGNPVVGVMNPNELTFSIVDGDGKILTSIQLSENIKSVHPLEKGFLLETFSKLHWIPEQQSEAQKTYDFKGQIQSTIATYLWNGEEFITFISEQKLHKLSLKTGKIETINIPVQFTNKLPQLHAFNHKNKLHIGYFSDQQFHALNISNNTWLKEDIKGEVVYSEKINGKVQYIEQIQGRGLHKALFGGELQIINAIKPNFGGLTKHNQQSIWMLRDNRDIFVYNPTTTKGTLVTIPGIEISAFEPIFNGDRLVGMLILDDVKNEVHHFKRNGEETELSSVQRFRGSKFIKITGNKQFITYVDGQLVGYGF